MSMRGLRVVLCVLVALGAGVLGVQVFAQEAGNPIDAERMRKYRCTIDASYVYDPAAGDPAAGIAPGTPFADLPESWYCPECGATKADFEPMSE